ncbi:MAG: hypothetical protein KatS3mg102_0757 [Planctomycetota bacterium]|nr:MAG: hypothetical protein KatS3mg102_0757 [Planctomycetota bacterium]
MPRPGAAAGGRRSGRGTAAQCRAPRRPNSCANAPRSQRRSASRPRAPPGLRPGRCSAARNTRWRRRPSRPPARCASTGGCWWRWRWCSPCSRDSSPGGRSGPPAACGRHGRSWSRPRAHPRPRATQRAGWRCTSGTAIPPPRPTCDCAPRMPGCCGPARASWRRRARATRHWPGSSPSRACPAIWRATGQRSPGPTRSSTPATAEGGPALEAVAGLRPLPGGMPAAPAAVSPSAEDHPGRTRPRAVSGGPSRRQAAPAGEPTPELTGRGAAGYTWTGWSPTARNRQQARPGGRCRRAGAAPGDRPARAAGRLAGPAAAGYTAAPRCSAGCASGASGRGARMAACWRRQPRRPLSVRWSASRSRSRRRGASSSSPSRSRSRCSTRTRRCWCWTSPPAWSCTPRRATRAEPWVNALLYRGGPLAAAGAESGRPGLVHRLDRDTSGVLVVARTDAVHRALVREFKARRVDKRYLAIVEGRPPADELWVREPIGRSTHHRKKMAVTPDGRPAETRVRLLERRGPYSVLECAPRTGRTHQIRVHLRHLGTPILCDRAYGRRSAIGPSELRQRARRPPGEQPVLARQALHAMSLEVDAPAARRTGPLRGTPACGSAGGASAAAGGIPGTGAGLNAPAGAAPRRRAARRRPDTVVWSRRHRHEPTAARAHRAVGDPARGGRASPRPRPAAPAAPRQGLPVLVHGPARARAGRQRALQPEAVGGARRSDGRSRGAATGRAVGGGARARNGSR